MERFWQDLRYAARVLIKNPVYSVVAILTLALGIGGNSTIFSWIEGIVLQPLAGVADQGRLVAIAGVRQPGDRCCTFTYPDYKDYSERNSVLDGIVAQELAAVNLSSDGDPVRVVAQTVSGNYFDVFGVKPKLGRTFLPEENQTPLTHPVTVISYGLWQKRYNRDPDIVGKTQILNGYKFTIIGVAPPEFRGTFVGYSIDLWVPVMMESLLYQGGDRLKDRGNFWLEGFARLKPGVTLQQAQEQVNAISHELQGQFPDTHKGFVLKLYPLSQTPFGMVDFLSPVLALSIAVVAVILLITCANLTGLVLGRSLVRRREIAVRMAMGAPRGRIIRQMITESVFLAFLGAIVGICIAYMMRGSLSAFFPRTNISIDLNGKIDGRVLGMTALVALITGIVFGLAPALQSSRENLVEAVKLRQGAASGKKGSWLRSSLVALQVALSLVLLVCASLFFQTIRNTRRADLGFKVDNLLVASMDLFISGYDETRGKIFYQQLLSRVEGLPGVESATLAWRLPLSLRNPQTVAITVPGYVPRNENDAPFAENNAVGPNYVKTFGLTLLAGRDFTRQDGDSTGLVCIVNQTMVQRYWPDQDVLGKRVQIFGKWAEVVGVVKDIKYHSLHESPQPYIYLPIQQFYKEIPSLAVRTSGDPTQLSAALRIAAKEINPQLLMYDVNPMTTNLSFRVFDQKIASVLLGVFGSIALVLAFMGLYGVVAISVTQRTQEIGIRMALGSQRSEILFLILRQGFVITLLGVVLGLSSAIGSTRFIANQIYGVSATDPLTFIAVSVLLLAIALVASLVPAMRATRVDPVNALRYE